MGDVIGIDLGTTNSCVAIGGTLAPEVIPNQEGARATPSVVAIGESGELLVGQQARRQAVTNPTNTVHAVKRLIGRRFDDRDVAKARDSLPYDIVRSDSNTANVLLGKEERTPAEISAMILQKLKHDAECFLGRSVKEAVVTVPAYFNDVQRQSTREAGRIAGLDVLRIINEPTAAALAYGTHERGEAKVAIFDLGGGTFDVSILQLDEGVFEVLATHGDTFLGGEDFDYAVMNFLANEFRESEGIDLRADRVALQRLCEAAEQAKRDLSTTTQTDINLPFITTADGAGSKHLHVHLTRAKLEELCYPLLDRLQEPCMAALNDAGLAAADVDDVLLVGGMTRMEGVRQRVRQIFGCEPRCCVNPDEVVALGAAIQGAVLAGSVKDVVLLDVTPLSLGIQTAGGRLTKLIERNTTIPTRRSEIFSTYKDNQENILVKVFQGEHEMAKDNQFLGQFQLDGIKRAARGVPQIEVNFEVDVNGVVNVSAVDSTTGNRRSIAVKPDGVDPRDVGHLIEGSDSPLSSQAMQARLSDAHYELRRMLERIETQIVKARERGDLDTNRHLEEALRKTKLALTSSDLDILDAALVVGHIIEDAESRSRHAEAQQRMRAVAPLIDDIADAMEDAQEPPERDKLDDVIPTLEPLGDAPAAVEEAAMHVQESDEHHEPAPTNPFSDEADQNSSTADKERPIVEAQAPPPEIPRSNVASPPLPGWPGEDKESSTVEAYAPPPEISHSNVAPSPLPGWPSEDKESPTVEAQAPPPEEPRAEESLLEADPNPQFATAPDENETCATTPDEPNSIEQDGATSPDAELSATISHLRERIARRRQATADANAKAKAMNSAA